MRGIAKVARFGVVMLVMTVLMAIVWEALLPGKVYHCTDDGGSGYLFPGDWVHGDVEEVDFIRDPEMRSMSEPDVIRKGWSVPTLWGVWVVMVLISVVISVGVARLEWGA